MSPRWVPADDQAEYDTARGLTREHGPYWLVLWSPSNRAYYAYWRGHGHVPPHRHPDPDTLSQQMERTRLAVAAGRPP